MQTLVSSVTHPLLRQYVQSFLFFKKSDFPSFAYTTFPNTNVCLAIYKNNQVTYTSNSSINHCLITPGKNQVVSRLYGFHERAFTVTIEGEMDQVCILFRPGALRAFTRESYENLLNSEHAFNDLFNPHSDNLSDQLFSLEEPSQRVNLLEQLLLSRLLSNSLNSLVTASLQLIGKPQTLLTIDHLAGSLQINPSTLYRLFIEHIGQSPKAFCQTVRFRNALSTLQTSSYGSLTQSAYDSNYYDQAHFIKHIRQLTGYSPRQLQLKSSVEQKELVWITT